MSNFYAVTLQFAPNKLRALAGLNTDRYEETRVIEAETYNEALNKWCPEIVSDVDSVTIREVTFIAKTDTN